MELEEQIKKANEGNREAQFIVGNAYEEGVLVPQDYEKAIEYYNMAANHGDLNAELRSVYCRTLNVKIKVVFSIKGYRNGRMVQDNKKFVIKCGESKVVPSYNTEEAFVINKYFLKEVHIKRIKNGVESEFVIEKGKVYEIDETGTSIQYHYSFEIVYSTKTDVLRNIAEERLLVDLDHYELEKKIFYLCHQKNLNLNPYSDDIALQYWNTKKEVLKNDYNIEWESPIDIANGDYDPTKIAGACEIDQEYWWSLL